MTKSVEYLFSDKAPIVYDIYVEILKRIKSIGPVIIEPKKTSIHLKSTSAFGGVHPKKNWLDFNLVIDHPLQSNHIIKVEQASKNRFHNYFRFNSIDDIDDDFIVLLRESYSLMNK